MSIPKPFEQVRSRSIPPFSTYKENKEISTSISSSPKYKLITEHKSKMAAVNKLNTKKFYDKRSIRCCKDGTLHKRRLELFTWSHTLVVMQISAMKQRALRL
jgi:hypothetical protein